MADMIGPEGEGEQGESMGPGKEQEYESGGGEGNQLIDALKTLGMFIQQQQAQNNPKAVVMLEHFQQLLMAIKPEGGEQAPEAAPAPAGEPAGIKQMSPGGVSRGGAPMRDNKSVPVL